MPGNACRPAACHHTVLNRLPPARSWCSMMRRTLLLRALHLSHACVTRRRFNSCISSVRIGQCPFLGLVDYFCRRTRYINVSCQTHTVSLLRSLCRLYEVEPRRVLRTSQNERKYPQTAGVRCIEHDSMGGTVPLRSFFRVFP